KKKLSGGSQRTLSVALSSLSLAELLIAQALYARRPRPVRTRLPERIRPIPALTGDRSAYGREH
ncbi:MAG TPA: hypothetical protein VHC20_01550, partial [Candidatus Paceibacterota bacterium]|nr:hypothetical protein [Candidatus Paceibacterota bacterium]